MNCLLNFLRGKDNLQIIRVFFSINLTLNCSFNRENQLRIILRSLNALVSDRFCYKIAITVTLTLQELFMTREKLIPKFRNVK